MSTASTSSRNPWLNCPRPNPRASLRLFCFPYAGGGISTYHSWSNNWLDEVEVCTIQLPGRENRLGEPPFTDLAPLLGALLPPIRPWLDRPFAFYGHSLGALIAFELARDLRRYADAGPVHLFVSSLRAPSLPNPNPPLQALPDGTFVSEIERLYGGIPGPVKEHQELMQLLLPTLRADVTLLERYLYVEERPLDCPISAFGGLDDSTIGRHELDAWRNQTSNSFSLRMLPGDHFFLRSAQDSLLSAVAQDLMLFLGSQSF